jgi:hypothetical protein
VFAVGAGFFALLTAFYIWGWSDVEDPLSLRSIALFAGMLATSLLPAVLGVRGARAGVLIRGDELVVRNVFRTHRLRIQDVEAVSIEARGFFPKVAVVRLKSGAEIVASGIQGPNPDVRAKARAAEDLVDTLNALITANRS